MMAGTGFFDQVEFIDTSSESIDKGDKQIINPEPLNDEVQTLEEALEPSLVKPRHAGFGVMRPSTGQEIVDAARNEAAVATIPVLCLIAAPQKAGKSGMVADSLTQEEVDNGAEIWWIDFDMGGDSTKAAHHSDKSKNIVVMSPWVLDDDHESRVPFNFPQTFKKVMRILRHANETARVQRQYFLEHGKMPNPYLKTICFDGADQWLNACATLMKVNDLELGPDGIATTGQKTTTKIGRFNWEIRANRYKSAIPHGLQEASRLGVHCYVITHMKPSYDKNGNEILGADVPDILPRSEGDYQQQIRIELIEERNEKGEKTGMVNSVAQVVENRTSLKAGERILIFRRGPDGGEWFGWKGLRDGSFEHPNDVLAPPE